MEYPNNIFAIMGALDAEIDEFIKHLDNPKIKNWQEFIFYEGSFCQKNIVIVKSGMGKVLAALTTQKLIDTYNPRAIIFTGVAGGLNIEHNIGDIVVARDCVQHDFDARELGSARGAIPYTNYRFFETDEYLRTLALSAKSLQTIYEGRILTGDSFLTKKEINKNKYLTEELKGDAVEMEGASVGQVCTVNDIPFLIIRTISDKANEEASVDFNKFLPIVAKNSFHLVSHILNEYQQ
ncbi:MAG: 5'-methylthioadenosine/adenosylhomocysteine nucleosidase [Patescibacteria group bacterium]